MNPTEETVEDRDLSRAVVEFLGKGRSPFPRTDEDAVLASAGEADGPALLARVRAIVDEMMAIKIDWSARTLAEGGREAEAILAGRHPELGADALEALYWMFTYNWR